MKSKYSVLAAAAALCILILDAKTALAGAGAGLELCIRSVIPALFPFLVICGYLTGNLPRIPFLGWLGRFCRIPAGSEGLLITGLLGGYPVGAAAVTQAWRDRRLTRDTARRMLGFCSNAGPAFLFGMLSQVFRNTKALWVLWGIHILSAVITARLLPGDTDKAFHTGPGNPVSLPDSLSRAVGTMGRICGWVILFRILLEFLERWTGWFFPKPVLVFLGGLTELANGCVSLSLLDSPGLRFLFASVFLAFGGLCVGMQTLSVTGPLGTGLYFPGKILQACISFYLAVILQNPLFPPDQRVSVPLIFLLAAGIPILWARIPVFRKKSSSNLASLGV
ncbi:MAG: hypothetical protein IKC09_00860 [Oscillospiraceae bacterium]|nr:hypothetical protein [Oscillospiraceae bacterium]